MKGKKILDVGCGGGRDIIEFLKLNLEPEGLDYSPAMIEVCKKQFPETKLFVADMRKTNQPNDYYDGIWACASIHHIKKEDMPKALGEFRRILKPKGQLFISVKKGDWEGILKQPGITRFYKFYTENELEDILEKNGFKVIGTEFRKFEDLTGTKKTETDHDWVCVYAEKM